MKEQVGMALLLTLLAVFVGGILWSIHQGQLACHAKGGAYVRGVIGMECVAGVDK